MAKYKVGDKVRIKKGIKKGYGKRYSPVQVRKSQRYVSASMVYMRGKTATIKEVIPLAWYEKPAYILDIDKGEWHWWGYTLKRVEG